MILNRNVYLVAKRSARMKTNSCKFLSTALPKTFDLESKVPRLQIPPLHQTVDRYLKSVEPWLSKSQFEATTKAAKEFVSPGGLGQVLQQRLQQLDASEKYSWLEKIWLNKAYLEFREPCFLNVNWYASLSEPHNAVLPRPNQALSYQSSEFQLVRASELIANILDFNDRLNSQEIPPDMGKDGAPLCMNQFKYQFGTTRIPKLGIDEVVSKYPNYTRHISVMYKDQVGKVNVYGTDGKRLSKSAIRASLKQLVDKIDSIQEKQPAVGVFTAMNRDFWATARSEMISLSKKNASNMEIIESSLFNVCLDVLADPKMGFDLDYRSNMFLKGDSGNNRWFDKAIQLIVTSSGHAGLNCEHTPVDANTTGRIISEALLSENGPNAYKENEDIGSQSYEPVELLEWELDTKLKEKLMEAKTKTGEFANSVNLETLDMTEFGGDKIKSLKLSPDSFVQMSIQLAYYKLHKTPCPTYEAAATRSFMHGRTECVRVCSNESVAFTKAMENPSMLKENKRMALEAALNSHKTYMGWGLVGQGVDRHLLGLKCQMEQGESDRATLFSDPAFGMSYNYKLSTSNVSPARLFRGGFAPVVHDGYGIAYGIDKNVMRFAISTWKNSECDLGRFKGTLGESVEEIIKLRE
ncbi:hypothetical protein BB559_001171 [Furculomyces boomerangus]|uniref:Choline/carnitine acyltransferase domain-containing protein n=2 Tax=Harpellales TaxID=61421 RepID=A0A2T9Z2V5_9FUNG|nr:hypothetical protein BB559_001171 [Furculomyces boomerangus]PWA01816.1 hypothetical protein BB558_002049 [Smittium angustum]